jgi:hypothetical protein
MVLRSRNVGYGTALLMKWTELADPLLPTAPTLGREGDQGTE